MLWFTLLIDIENKSEDQAMVKKQVFNKFEDVTLLVSSKTTLMPTV